MPRAPSVGQAALRAPHDPQGLAAYVLRYLEWLQVHNYAAPTMQNRQSYLGTFVGWYAERGLATPNVITKPILERYQQSLYTHRKGNGEPLTFSAQHARLIPVRALFKWCAKQNYLLYRCHFDEHGADGNRKALAG